MPARIDLINGALTDIGARPLANEDATGAAPLVDQYNRLVNSLMAYPWSFQSKLVQLIRLSASPGVKWQYAYQLPLADMLGSPRALYDQLPSSQVISGINSIPNGYCGPSLPFLDWERFSDQIWTNASQLWMRYTQAPDPNLWPGYFVQIIVDALKAEFALSVREDLGLYKTLRQFVYGDPSMPGDTGMLGQAKMTDASSQPSRSVPMVSNPLTAVRL